MEFGAHVPGSTYPGPEVAPERNRHPTLAPVWSKLTVWFDRKVGRRSYRIHRSLYRWTGGVIGHRTPAGSMLLLTTVGRRTGQKHTTPLLYMPDGPDFVVVGSNGGRPEPPAWILNLTATPLVELQVGRRRCTAEARVLEGEAKAAMWPRLIGHYQGWGSYQALTEREIKVVSLVPVV
jgi:deazaflavin-dependent oxidoreductase (nitroreductase family)